MNRRDLWGLNMKSSVDFSSSWSTNMSLKQTHQPQLQTRLHLFVTNKLQTTSNNVDSRPDLQIKGTIVQNIDEPKSQKLN